MSVILYKYRSYDNYSLKLIKDRELWFSVVSDFNDIFEGTAIWHMDGTRSELRKYLTVTNSLSADDIEGVLNMFPRGNIFNCDSIEYQIKEQVIYCLSETREDILMWSHYANNHKGFCLGFESFINHFDTSSTPQIKLEHSSLDVSKFPFPYFGVTLPVEYNEVMPSSNRLKLSNEDVVKTLTRKHPSWSYEKERRIIIPKRNLVNGNQAIQFEQHVLKEVIFGLRCPSEMRKNIMELVKYNYPNGQVKFFECKFPDKPSKPTEVKNIKYELKIVEL